MKETELTILIPALNEEKTIGICIEKAQKFIKENNLNKKWPTFNLKSRLFFLVYVEFLFKIFVCVF